MFCLVSIHHFISQIIAIAQVLGHVFHVLPTNLFLVTFFPCGQVFYCVKTQRRYKVVMMMYYCVKSEDLVRENTRRGVMNTVFLRFIMG
ncbi:hypothetical protein RJT34_09034 [Clitoria ternatea]|uniref:Uncharacterized protein n=1 Tax=Clitoria ternatea TaxID=43366 RepID=A0AAN9K581_CLITE